MTVNLSIEPHCSQWLALLDAHTVADGSLAGRTLAEWRATARHELGLAVDRHVIATGHQTLLWHPGILAKYLAAHAFAQQHDLATANLIVDQHAEGFGAFEIPVRRTDETLAARRIELTTPRPGVPMGLHDPFDPAPLPTELRAALPSVERGALMIHDAIAQHRDAPNASLQMARALNHLMKPWIDPMPAVCATSLVNTSFGRALMEKMIENPQSCAELYNAAVRDVPDAGIGPLLIRDDYIELPLWRIGDDGRRMHAYDNDVETWLDDPTTFTIMPRALFMTALVRLVMCDIFVHGTGAAIYDRAMELWIDNWLGVVAAPKVVATADVYLPLLDDDDRRSPSITNARQHYRRLWHDPETVNGAPHPGETKQHWLKTISEAPRRSLARREAFYRMHDALDELRHAHADAVLDAEQQLRAAERVAQNCAIAGRRDWPFPLYPTAMIDDLAESVHKALSCPPRQLA